MPSSMEVLLQDLDKQEAGLRESLEIIRQRIALVQQARNALTQLAHEPALNLDHIKPVVGKVSGTIDNLTLISEAEHKALKNLVQASPTLQLAIVTLLRRSQKPLTAPQISHRLQLHGWVSKAANPNNVVGNALRNNSYFKHDDERRWTLTDSGKKAAEIFEGQLAEAWDVKKLGSMGHTEVMEGLVRQLPD